MISKPKKINQYNLNGEFIKSWNSLVQASVSCKINISTISLAINNKVKTAGGFVFKKYIENFPLKINSVPSCPSSKKTILQYSKNEDFIKEWPSIRQAALTLKIFSPNISRCALNKKYHKTAGGFIWKYKN